MTRREPSRGSLRGSLGGSLNDAAMAAYLTACRLDVAVRKPGNVSVQSPGHRMDAAMFVRSAGASAGPLFEPGARVGRRIEAAVAATWQVAGCNTNLGVVLLCAPLAAALDGLTERPNAHQWQARVERILAELDVADAAAAYRAIAMANPAGLGRVETADVHDAPVHSLREAMRIAASRDAIARQYDNGFAQVFGLGLRALSTGAAPRLGDLRNESAVQRLYLAWLAELPDSHIVRKHGEPVAQTVMRAAQRWRAHTGELEGDPAFAAWDEALKADAINPGTSADLTVATLFVAGVLNGVDAA